MTSAAAAAAADQSPTAAQTSPQHTTAASRAENIQTPPSSSPVEMSTLPTPLAGSTPPDTLTPSHATQSTAPATKTPAPQTSEAIPPVSTLAGGSSSVKPTPSTNPNCTETEAIGPSTDTPTTAPDNTHGPVLVIMLLLITGARHPYKIDDKYLKKRNVTVEGMDPINISVYTLKELIWRDWREEWDPRPTSPSSIRLIHFGRMLDDKTPLKESRFQTDSPNVVHMTVKPQEVVDEEDAKIAKGATRRDGEDEPTAGCRCVIL